MGLPKSMHYRTLSASPAALVALLLPLVLCSMACADSVAASRAGSSDEACDLTEALKQRVANAAAGFAQCLAAYGSPVTYCEKCTEVRNEWHSAFKSMPTECQDSGVYKTLQASLDTSNIGTDLDDDTGIWANSYCASCTKNETSHFSNLLNTFYECIVANTDLRSEDSMRALQRALLDSSILRSAGDAICTNCSKAFNDIDDYHDSLSLECRSNVDIVDKYRRMLETWRLHSCTVVHANRTAMYVVLAIAIAVPVMFYLSTYLLSRKSAHRSEQELIEQSLLLSSDFDLTHERARANSTVSTTSMPAVIPSHASTSNIRSRISTNIVSLADSHASRGSGVRRDDGSRPLVSRATRGGNKVTGSSGAGKLSRREKDLRSKLVSDKGVSRLTINADDDDKYYLVSETSSATGTANHYQGRQHHAMGHDDDDDDEYPSHEKIAFEEDANDEDFFRHTRAHADGDGADEDEGAREGTGNESLIARLSNWSPVPSTIPETDVSSASFKHVTVQKSEAHDALGEGGSELLEAGDGDGSDAGSNVVFGGIDGDADVSFTSDDAARLTHSSPARNTAEKQAQADQPVRVNANEVLPVEVDADANGDEYAPHSEARKGKKGWRKTSSELENDDDLGNMYTRMPSSPRHIHIEQHSDTVRSRRGQLSPSQGKIDPIGEACDLQSAIPQTPEREEAPSPQLVRQAEIQSSFPSNEQQQQHGEQEQDGNYGCRDIGGDDDEDGSDGQEKRLVRQDPVQASITSASAPSPSDSDAQCEPVRDGTGRKVAGDGDDGDGDGTVNGQAGEEGKEREVTDPTSPTKSTKSTSSHEAKKSKKKKKRKGSERK